MKRNLIFLFLFLGLATSVRSQVDVFSEIENSSRTQISELEFEDLEPIDDELKTIDDLKDVADHDITPFKPPRKEIRPTRPPEWKPEPFSAVLKEGSIIKDMKTGKRYRVRKKVIVKAEEKFNGSLISYVHNSKKELAFETRTHNLVDISRDLDLLTDLPAHEEFPPRTQWHTTNKYFKVQNGLYYTVENISAPYFADFFDTEGTVATAYRWDYRFFFRWEVPVYFGLTGGVQTGTFDTGDGAILKWTSYYFGPGLKWRFKDGESWAWELHTDFQKSMNFNAVVDGGIQARFGSNLWNLEGIGVWKTGIGQFTFHAGIKKQRMTLKSSNAETIQKSDRSSLTYLAFGLGYQWDFDI
ncbi:MAG: hypothetical protein EP326_04130 [Deltaproteobacteria bacterium]|nr:MAG: hypothetical protein EP326_04130 [Deltaproteobacteria bacterium]